MIKFENMKYIIKIITKMELHFLFFQQRLFSLSQRSDISMGFNNEKVTFTKKFSQAVLLY